ncbi:MAG: DUF4097 domain-containing protein [Methanomicrobiales archaeon]|nr:DUF4097 domain-containing protein [Methanomicrobiales archaeon]
MLTVCGILAIVLFTGCLSPSLPGAETTRDFQGTYNVSRATSLEVHNLNGAVEVNTSTQDTAQVNATLRSVYGSSELDQVQVSVLTDDVLQVETVHLAPQVRVTVNYQIMIPRGLLVSIIENSNGGLTVRNAMGNAQLVTSNGPITVETFAGDITARTSNGPILIENVAGTLSASTSNAEITLHNISSILRAETSNGRIDADILSAGQDVIISTSNAQVMIQLAPDLDADLVMSTSNGKILVTNVPVTVQQATSTELRGTIGQGGKRITVTTSNADILVDLLNL